MQLKGQKRRPQNQMRQPITISAAHRGRTIPNDDQRSFAKEMITSKGIAIRAAANDPMQHPVDEHRNSSRSVRLGCGESTKTAKAGMRGTARRRLQTKPERSFARSDRSSSAILLLRLGDQRLLRLRGARPRSCRTRYRLRRARAESAGKRDALAALLAGERDALFRKARHDVSQ